MSSDKHPAEETPTERLLREALTARANQVTVHSLRQAAPPKSRLRKLKPVYAVTVPLFALAAASAGFYTIHGTPTAAKRDNGPAASVSASPTGAVELPADPSPSASASPSSVPALAQDYQLDVVTVEFEGVDKSARATVGGDATEFRVKYTNTTEVRFDGLLLDVNEMPIAESCTDISKAGSLQADDGSGWKEIPAAVATDGFAGRVLYSLEPGASKEIRYRYQARAAHPVAPSTLRSTVLGRVDGGPRKIGQAQVTLDVVDPAAPTAVIASGPTAFIGERSKGQVDIDVRNPSGAAMQSAAPTLTLYSDQPYNHDRALRAGRIKVEANVDGQWRELAAGDSCHNTITIDTTGIARPVPAGGSARFTIRFGYGNTDNMTSDPWVFTIGAVSGAHRSATVEGRAQVSIAVPEWALPDWARTPAPAPTPSPGTPSPSASAGASPAAGG